MEKVVAQNVSLLSRYVVEEGHCQRIARGFPVFPHNILTTPFILLYPNSLLWRVGFRVHVYASGIVLLVLVLARRVNFIIALLQHSYLPSNKFSRKNRNGETMINHIISRISFNVYNNCDNYFLFCVWKI